MNRIFNSRTLLQRTRQTLLCGLMLAATLPAVRGGTFGRVVPIGGLASDIVLDEPRGVLYIANFSANRIEVMSTANLAISRSINVAGQPGAMAMSRDGKYLVIAHYGNFQTPNPPNNSLTLIHLENNTRQSFGLASAPLGVAFGNDGLALILTTNEFLQFDPTSGATYSLGKIADIAAKTLPVAVGSFPPSILTAAVGASADGQRIFGISDAFRFAYDVQTQSITALFGQTSPPLSPRVVSVSRDGSYFAGGWAVFDSTARLLNQFNGAADAQSLGTLAIDSGAGLIYAQVPETSSTAAVATSSKVCLPDGRCIVITDPPLPGAAPANASRPSHLQIVDADNLTVRERLLLPENLGGRSVLNAAGDAMYAISASGVTVFPLGSLRQVRRVVASQEDVIFRGSFCDRRPMTREITIGDPSGAQTDFKLSAVDAINGQKVTISPSSGVTPAKVTITVDPGAFQSQNGTTSIFLRLESSAAANLQSGTCPAPTGDQTFASDCIRLLINNREPDQRGTIVNLAGKLVDLLADPSRDRFYVLRQDKNQVLVFNGSNATQIGALRTANTPTQMAITFDRKYLLVGHENSRLAYVFDLDTLQASEPIQFPRGFYPRSLASSGRTVLAASRVAGPKNLMARVDMDARAATEFSTLGPFENNISADTVLVASPNGSSIMAAMPDGTMLLYNAGADTFVVARKDFPALSGAYAASDFDQFAVDNNLLNSSLVRTRSFEPGPGISSGFAFVDQTVIRTTAPLAVPAGNSGTATQASSNSPGVIQRYDLDSGAQMRSARTIELPVLSSVSPSGAASISVFSRTLAPLANRNNIISLTQSGFTVLPWNYDNNAPAPRLDRVVNAVDQSQTVASGSLVTISGSGLNAANGDSCVTLNGVLFPQAVVGNSFSAQLPFNLVGSAQLVAHTPGGISDPLNFTVLPTAPSIFYTGKTPTDPGIATVYRVANNTQVTLTNPVHKGDELIILAGGLGQTSPAVEAGAPAPSNPPAVALIKPVVTLDGAELPVLFAGLAPGQVGVYQINVKVPKGVQQGLTVPLKIAQGEASSIVFVRVVE